MDRARIEAAERDIIAELALSNEGYKNLTVLCEEFGSRFGWGHASAVLAQIARRLYISESTAKTHVAKIYEKLGAGNRAQAVMAAVRLGLVPAEKAGPLARYAAEGVETSVVCATRGERGWPADAADYPGLDGLGRLREAELRAAAAILGGPSVCSAGAEGPIYRPGPIRPPARRQAPRSARRPWPQRLTTQSPRPRRRSAIPLR